MISVNNKNPATTLDWSGKSRQEQASDKTTLHGHRNVKPVSAQRIMGNTGNGAGRYATNLVATARAGVFNPVSFAVRHPVLALTGTLAAIASNTGAAPLPGPTGMQTRNNGTSLQPFPGIEPDASPEFLPPQTEFPVVDPTKTEENLEKIYARIATDEPEWFRQPHDTAEREKRSSLEEPQNKGKVRVKRKVDPTVVSMPDSYNFTVGDNATLECTVPSPSFGIYWSKFFNHNERELMSCNSCDNNPDISMRYLIKTEYCPDKYEFTWDTDNGNYTMIIPNIQEDDAGVFQCAASYAGERGSSSHAFENPAYSI